MITCYQVNLRDGWGGAEVYTASFTRALLAAGVPTTLFVHPDSPYWKDLLPQGCAIIPARDYGELLPHLPDASWLLFQTPIYAAQAVPFRQRGHFLTSVAHMTLFGRSPAVLNHLDWIAGDSQYVLDSLAAAGITQFHAEPLWGIAELKTRMGGADQPIVANCPYGWDPRKVRDRLLSWLYPYYERLLPRRPYVRRPGITLGIVSRLADPKQFPLLLGHIAPILARHPQINLEIFGDGGYATVRDMRRALAPMRGRVRFWGYQQYVGAVYRQIDYLLAGLPEKEAFGLNLVEAEICGTPVLAVNAPPFVETVADGVTGFLYEDPRQDGGAGFARLVERLLRRPFKLESASAAAYLERFSEAAYHERVARFVESTLRVKSSFHSIPLQEPMR
ncbi:MAG: glycosyltransferase family 4 protein [Rhodocyclales bacterium]|nr:glycosyltransferase family 4 protein [Rhodocyclales bacterium]